MYHQVARAPRRASRECAAPRASTIPQGNAQGRSVLGTKSKISGSNLFSRLNFWVVTAGGSIMTTPPALTGVAAPATATVALSASAMTFTLDSIPDSVTNLKLVILASEPQATA